MLKQPHRSWYHALRNWFHSVRQAKTQRENEKAGAEPGETKNERDDEELRSWAREYDAWLR